MKAIEIIDSASLQAALVVDENRRLLGIVTDGDVRRAILSGISLQEPVSRIMVKQPITSQAIDSRQSVFQKMKKHSLHHIPLVDEKGCIVGIEIVDNILNVAKRENCVVFMAGGLGTRLRPLTQERPKPLLHVGDRPLLETSLMNFIEYGFTKFYMAVNYKAEMFQEYFGDGSKWGVEIRYLHEREQLGTAGALSLLPEAPSQPFFVMNGDLLTKVNFQQLLEFHHEHNAAATMCVREYDFQVPYGVVQTEEGHRITNLDEKPVQRFFVNAGIYVLNPDVLRHIPNGQRYDMTTLFNDLASKKAKTSAFPIREYWMDIGQLSDFERAQGEFSQVFK